MGGNLFIIMEKEKDLMNVPSEKAFALSKVKLLKGGGLSVHYEVTEVIGQESYTNKYQVDSAKDVHPDLFALFANIRPIMGRVFNFVSSLSMTEADEYQSEILDKLDVRGVSLSGMDDNLGVVIYGTYETRNGQKVAVNTPRIQLGTISFGFEEELEEIIGQIEGEVYAFLFKGKKAELELFGEDGEPMPEAEN